MTDQDRIAKARKSLAWLRDTDDTARDSRAFADRQAAYASIEEALSLVGKCKAVWGEWVDVECPGPSKYLRQGGESEIVGRVDKYWPRIPGNGRSKRPLFVAACGESHSQLETIQTYPTAAEAMLAVEGRLAGYP